MIHIYRRSDKKFDVAIVSANGSEISQTTQGFTRKSGAIKNIRSQWKEFAVVTDNTWTNFQDDTQPVSVVYRISHNAVVKTDIKPNKAYKPKRRKR